MPLNFQLQRLLCESERLQEISRAIREQAQIEKEMLQTVNLLQDELKTRVKEREQRAKERLSTRGWQNRVLALRRDELQMANGLWRDLKAGMPEAPKRLYQLPEHIRAVVLEALVVAMKTRKTEDSILATFATQSISK